MTAIAITLEAAIALFDRNEDGTYTATHGDASVTLTKVNSKRWDVTCEPARTLTAEQARAKSLKVAREQGAALLVELVTELAAATVEPDPQPEPAEEKPVRSRPSYRAAVLQALALIDSGESTVTTDKGEQPILAAVFDVLDAVRPKQATKAPVGPSKADLAAKHVVVPVETLWRAGAMRELHRLLCTAEDGMTTEAAQLALEEQGRGIKGLKRYLAEMVRGVKLVPAGWFCEVLAEGDEPPRYRVVPMTTPEIVAAAEARAETQEHAQHPTHDSTWTLPETPLV